MIERTGVPPRPNLADWLAILAAYVVGAAVISGFLFFAAYLAGLGWTLGVKDAWNEPPYAESAE